MYWVSNLQIQEVLLESQEGICFLILLLVVVGFFSTLPIATSMITSSLLYFSSPCAFLPDGDIQDKDSPTRLPHFSDNQSMKGPTHPLGFVFETSPQIAQVDLIPCITEEAPDLRILPLSPKL